MVRLLDKGVSGRAHRAVIKRQGSSICWASVANLTSALWVSLAALHFVRPDAVLKMAGH
jgi:hypothetical protein